ncbi:BTAD domain-containing putative transcriptional regulator [Streptomyces asiaticus]
MSAGCAPSWNRSAAAGAGHRTGQRKHGIRAQRPLGARDTARFETVTRNARELLSRGRLEQAQREIGSALSMWRGGALADAVHHAFAAREITRLEETRPAWHTPGQRPRSCKI